MFCLYDPVSKILYSGDIGTSIGAPSLICDSFKSVEPFMRSYHQRYAYSRERINSWVRQIQDLDIETIAPARGSILRGRQKVEAFFEWLQETPCGIDLM